MRRGSLTLAHPSRAYTISRVAKMLGEEEQWLDEVAFELEPEDGRVYIWGDGDDPEIGLTDFGIESLQDLIREYRAQGNAPSPKR